MIMMRWREHCWENQYSINKYKIKYIKKCNTKCNTKNINIKNINLNMSIMKMKKTQGSIFTDFVPENFTFNLV